MTAPAAPATFRAAPIMSLVAVGFGLLGLSPIAFQGGAFWLVLLVPVAVAVWVVRTRTVVDADGLHVLQAWGRRDVPWSRVRTLRLAERGRVRAVDVDDREHRLVGVRVRDLGRVGAASGGRITVPSPAEAEAAAEHERELAAARMRVQRLREQQEAEPADGHTDDPDDGPADAADTPTEGSGGRRGA